MGNEPPQTLKTMVENGRLGFKKSGKGFFKKDGSVDPEALKLIPVEKKTEVDNATIEEMLFTAFVGKGKELLDTGVVEQPGDIDMGTIWGLGFPAYTGGPLKWADLTGTSKKLYGKEFYL